MKAFFINFLFLAAFFLVTHTCVGQKSLSLCEGLYQITANYSSEKFRELDKNIATRIIGFGKGYKHYKSSKDNSPELENDGNHNPKFIFAMHHLNTAKEKPSVLFSSLYTELAHCTGQEPDIVENGNRRIVKFYLKGMQVALAAYFVNEQVASANDEFKITIIKQ